MAQGDVDNCTPGIRLGNYLHELVLPACRVQELWYQASCKGKPGKEAPKGSVHAEGMKLKGVISPRVRSREGETAWREVLAEQSCRTGVEPPRRECLGCTWRDRGGGAAPPSERISLLIALTAACEAVGADVCPAVFQSCFGPIFSLPPFWSGSISLVPLYLGIM